MKMYYECHITFIGSKKDENIIEDLGWKFSIIDGDPVLGNGVKSYATKHYPISVFRNNVLDEVLTTANKMRESGLEVLREKVELVIYDSKQNSEIK